MKQEILALKRAILELEVNSSVNKENKLIKSLDNIICICEKIKSGFQKKCDTTYKNLKCSRINTISFLYKPLRVRNYFEGDYIVRFGAARSQDLKDAKALKAHNEFWIQHKTIKGNIFGSVPKELLNENSIKSLVTSGWMETEVDIFDISDGTENIREIMDFCEREFNHYILIEEELTNTHLILHYKIG